MSFSEIRLPNLVLVDFYKSTLVDIPEKKQKTAKNEVAVQTTTSPIPLFLGENLKNILILVNYPQEEFLPGEQLDFLSNILKACDLEISDIAVVNTSNLQANLDDLINTLQPKAILFFGKQPLITPGDTTIADFTITELSGIPMVHSPALESLNKNNTDSKLLKRKLWECLKQLFKI